MPLPMTFLSALQRGRHLLLIGSVAAPGNLEGMQMRARFDELFEVSEDLTALTGPALDERLRIILAQHGGAGQLGPEARAMSFPTRGVIHENAGVKLPRIIVHATCQGLMSAGVGERQLEILRGYGISVWVWAEYATELCSGPFTRALMSESPYWVVETPISEVGRRRVAELMTQDAGARDRLQTSGRFALCAPARRPGARPGAPVPTVPGISIRA